MDGVKAVTCEWWPFEVRTEKERRIMWMSLLVFREKTALRDREREGGKGERVRRTDKPRGRESHA